jgi:hypothetical protein
VKCGLSEQAMATRQNTRAMVFHAIQIRMIIPVHIFTDKQRNQADHKTKLEEPFWNKTSCHNHVQELQQN